MNTYSKLHNRLIDIIYKKNLSHISSCVTTLPILVDRYSSKNENDIVILSNGHAGLAQYVCMEHYENNDAEQLFDKYGVHPEKNKSDKIFCSTGSLGLGLPIAIGSSMANKENNVYCIISDGECCEGSIWESFYYLSKNPLSNLKIFVNANGFSAYDKINISKLSKCIKSFEIKNLKVVDTSNILKKFKYLNEKSIESHYCKIIDDEILTQLKYEI
jgi:transketolase